MKPKHQKSEPQGHNQSKPAAKKSSEPQNFRRELKERVLQARVSKSLYSELVERAQKLRVPVSNLVRNILEDSFHFVENIVEGGLDIAQSLAQEAGNEDFATVLGWQPMVANKQLSCCACQQKIARGSEAYISLGAPEGRSFVICKQCKPG